MAFKYQEVELRKVMQFYADHFEGDQLGRRLDGSVDAEWWIDQAKGSVVFRLYETAAEAEAAPVSEETMSIVP